MKKTNGRRWTGPNKHDVIGTKPKKQHRKEAHNIVNKQHMNMVRYAGCGMWCICMIWKEMIEPSVNLEIQECHWKVEVISVEIYIKFTGIGCTVWKWQAKQIWHRSAIISKWPTKCVKINMLHHSNMTTKYMAGIHSWCLTKEEHWATANSSINRFKQAWQKCKW